MLRALIGSFLLGPLLPVAAMLLWSKTGLALLIVIVVLFGALMVVMLAVAAAGRGVKHRSGKTLPYAPPPSAKGIGASENLASNGRWRRAFMGWRYGPPRE